MSGWYPGSFTLDSTGDGATDTVNFVAIDLDGDGSIDRLELSSDDGIYGETGDLGNKLTATDDDELFNAGGGASTSLDITLGAYQFTVTFQHALSGGNAIASVTSKTWFTGIFSIDTDSSGATDTVNFALKDHNSDGLYDRMGISINDTDYGDGDTSNQIANVTQDELVTGAEDVLIGADYTFSFTFDSNPANDVIDATATSKTWFTGALQVDANADGDTFDAADDLRFALADTDSNGLYDLMGLSVNDNDYDEGATGDQVLTTSNDEVITS